jgi:hypothetical protein
MMKYYYFAEEVNLEQALFKYDEILLPHFRKIIIAPIKLSYTVIFIPPSRKRLQDQNTFKYDEILIPQLMKRIKYKYDEVR